MLRTKYRGKLNMGPQNEGSQRYGVGITKFGELWDKSLRQLGLETGLANKRCWNYK